MTDATLYFILVHDTTLRQLEVREFGADSLDTIKRTHSPYFATGSAHDIVEDFVAQIV